MTVTGNEQQAYVPVKVDGMFGWVASQWVQRGAIALEQPASQTQPGTATTIGAVDLFAAPDDQSGIVGAIPSTSVVSLTGEAQDGFLGVAYDNQTGWADAAYLQVAEAAPDSALLQPAAPIAEPQEASAAPASSNGIAPAIGGEAITTTNVNLRSQPSPDSMVISVVPAGSQVSLTGSQANGYVNVRIGGQAGWLDSSYLQ